MEGNLVKVEYTTDTHVAYQTSILGLDERTILMLSGKRVLDVACGLGKLVEHLRKRGVNAEGIDPRAPRKSHFTRRKIEGLGQGKGIPADNQSIDLITSFQNPVLTTIFGASRERWAHEYSKMGPAGQRAYQKDCEIAHYFLSEIGRTIKVGGRALIFPYLPHLEKVAGHILRMDRVEIDREAIDVNAALRYRHSQ